MREYYYKKIKGFHEIKNKDFVEFFYKFNKVLDKSEISKYNECTNTINTLNTLNDTVIVGKESI